MQQVLSELREGCATDLSSGGKPARDRAAAMDDALRELAGTALDASPPLAVVAVGGYGRGELSPRSDIDLLILVRGVGDISPATVRGLLYPLWDCGYEVGHGVRTPREAMERCSSDLDAATSILSSRLVAGNEKLFHELMDRRTRWLARDAKSVARRIAESTRQRHRRVERAGWVLAPDLKEDVGGLRDVHRLRWLHVLAARPRWPEPVVAAEELLLAVREALHPLAKRRQDRIRIELQATVAHHLQLEGDQAATELMREVHNAARTIEHLGGVFELEMLDDILGGPRRSGGRRSLSRFTRVEDGAVTIDEAAPRSSAAAMDLLAQRARVPKTLDPPALRWLGRTFAGLENTEWEPPTLAAFFDVLRGPFVIDALELLDHTGGWRALMPEWLRVRTLAQNDPYHRYTVDAHLFAAVGEIPKVIADDRVAAIAAEEAGELDLLHLAALLHDIGKGSGEDHSIAGERMAAGICTRMGLAGDEVRLVASLVRHHLTLVDTATRRDLDDGGVIASVAESIGDARRLRLLYILTVADGRATGPQGWSDWKAALVRDLYSKALTAIETGTAPPRSDVRMKAEEIEAYEPSLAGHAFEVLETLPPSYLASTHLPDIVDDIRLLLRPPPVGGLRHRLERGTEHDQCALTLCVPDRPGALARTAGVLSLHRMSVRRAQAFSTSDGMALQRFILAPTHGDASESMLHDLEAAYSGRLALEARLEHKISDYGETLEPADIRILQEASDHSSVIEVRTSDAIGLLYGIAAALGDLDLDIHVAKIDTLGERVVDVFYVRDLRGAKLNEEQEAEVRRSIHHRLSRLYPS